MRLTKTLLLLACTLLLAACNNRPICDEQRTFAGDIWNRFTAENFDIAVSNINDYYHLDVTAAIDTARYRYDIVPLMVNLTSPGGEERQFYGVIQLKDKGRPRGEMVDGYRVVSGRLRSFFSFNHAGTHKMAISQTTSQYDLEGIHSLSLTVTRAKLDYDL